MTAPGTEPRGDELIVDADGHVCEPYHLWEHGLPDHLADRGIVLRWNESTGYDECYVEGRLVTDRGLATLKGVADPQRLFAVRTR